MAQRHPVKPVPVLWEPAFWDMSEYQASTNAPSNALGLAPATAGRGGEPFGLSSPQPGRAVAAAPGRPSCLPREIASIVGSSELGRVSLGHITANFVQILQFCSIWDKEPLFLSRNRAEEGGGGGMAGARPGAGRGGMRRHATPG